MILNTYRSISFSLIINTTGDGRKNVAFMFSTILYLRSVNWKECLSTVYRKPVTGFCFSILTQMRRKSIRFRASQVTWVSRSMISLSKGGLLKSANDIVIKGVNESPKKNIFFIAKLLEVHYLLVQLLFPPEEVAVAQ